MKWKLDFQNVKKLLKQFNEDLSLIMMTCFSIHNSLTQRNYEIDIVLFKYRSIKRVEFYDLTNHHLELHTRVC